MKKTTLEKELSFCFIFRKHFRLHEAKRHYRFIYVNLVTISHERREDYDYKRVNSR